MKGGAAGFGAALVLAAVAYALFGRARPGAPVAACACPSSVPAVTQARELPAVTPPIPSVEDDPPVQEDSPVADEPGEPAPEPPQGLNADWPAASDDKRAWTTIERELRLEALLSAGQVQKLREYREKRGANYDGSLVDLFDQPWWVPRYQHMWSNARE